MTRSARFPVSLLALAGATLLAGLIAWSNTRHLSCDDTEDLRLTQAVARWFALVVAPGCAGAGLISQYPVCPG